MKGMVIKVGKGLKVTTANFKGVRIIAVQGGFQIVGQEKVWQSLVKLTDSIK